MPRPLDHFDGEIDPTLWSVPESQWSAEDAILYTYDEYMTYAGIISTVPIRVETSQPWDNYRLNIPYSSMLIEYFTPTEGPILPSGNNYVSLLYQQFWDAKYVPGYLAYKDLPNWAEFDYYVYIPFRSDSVLESVTLFYLEREPDELLRHRTKTCWNGSPPQFQWRKRPYHRSIGIQLDLTRVLFRSGWFKYKILPTPAGMDPVAWYDQAQAEVNEIEKSFPPGFFVSSPVPVIEIRPFDQDVPGEEMEPEPEEPFKSSFKFLESVILNPAGPAEEVIWIRNGITYKREWVIPGREYSPIEINDQGDIASPLINYYYGFPKVEAATVQTLTSTPPPRMTPQDKATLSPYRDKLAFLYPRNNYWNQVTPSVPEADRLVLVGDINARVWAYRFEDGDQFPSPSGVNISYEPRGGPEGWEVAFHETKQITGVIFERTDYDCLYYQRISEEDLGDVIGRQNYSLRYSRGLKKQILPAIHPYYVWSHPDTGTDDIPDIQYSLLLNAGVVLPYEEWEFDPYRDLTITYLQPKNQYITVEEPTLLGRPPDLYPNEIAFKTCSSFIAEQQFGGFYEYRTIKVSRLITPFRWVPVMSTDDGGKMDLEIQILDPESVVNLIDDYFYGVDGEIDMPDSVRIKEIHEALDAATFGNPENQVDLHLFGRQDNGILLEYDSATPLLEAIALTPENDSVGPANLGNYIRVGIQTLGMLIGLHNYPLTRTPTYQEFTLEGERRIEEKAILSLSDHYAAGDYDTQAKLGLWPVVAYDYGALVTSERQPSELWVDSVAEMTANNYAVITRGSTCWERTALEAYRIDHNLLEVAKAIGSPFQSVFLPWDYGQTDLLNFTGSQTLAGGITALGQTLADMGIHKQVPQDFLDVVNARKAEILNQVEGGQ